MKPQDTESTKKSPELIEGVLAGRKLDVAKFFNLIEDRRPEQAAAAAKLLDQLYLHSLSKSHTIGITGPPGAGKSCLVSRLIRAYRAAGKTVGVIAIDPSSKTSRGALLGDRVRFDYDVNDAGVFVRSMANRAEAGGVSDRTFAGIVTLRAAYDVVLVETVGIGQTESDIAGLVDTTVLIVQPGSGDVLQFLKAGIMEEPHILAVNKADLGTPARRAYNDLRAAMEHGEHDASRWQPRVLLCSAQTGEGIEELIDSAAGHYQHLSPNLRNIRLDQAAVWILQALCHLYGVRGVDRFGAQEKIAKRLSRNQDRGPFETLDEFAEELDSRIRS